MRADPAERFASGAELAVALRQPSTVPGRQAAGQPPTWWWQFHQAAISIVLAAMPALAWGTRAILERPRGSFLFFAALVLATVSITARMNLVFTARVHPANLAGQRAVVFPWVAILDALLAMLMIATAVALAGDHDLLAGLAIALGAIILVSAAFIEPATTRAAGLQPTR
jgi:hypothetical protein